MRRTLLVSTAVAALFLSCPAVAQTPPSGSTQTAGQQATTDVVAVPIWPTAAVQLPEQQPSAASFALGKVEGIAPELVAGVTAKGYARKVSVEGQTIGQVMVVSVAKGDREETISTEGLTAQFDAAGTNQLFPEKNLQVEGSKSALVAALQRLATAKPAEKKKDAPKDDATQNAVSGTGSKNGEAAGYQSPTVTGPTGTEAKEPVTDNRVTTEGCKVRVDTNQELAIQQSKLQTVTDGVLTDGSCTDSDEKYPIKRSYATCPADIVDLTVMTAWPQYTLYYVDGAGETHTVSECTKDTDSPYTVVEDEDKCPIDLDFENSLAIPQATLVYTNRNNAVTQVPGRGCGPSTKSAAIPMVESTTNCSLRHDFAAKKSYERSMWTYTRDGLTYQAAPCGDTGREFAHDTIYADLAGNYVCTPITNLTTKSVTLQSRIRVTIDGAPQYITECTPDSSTKGIFPTTDGCMDPSKWVHDLEGSVSYGQERFWYAKADGSREYVTQCQKSTTTYPHDVTITGYQAHDDQLWAYPLSTVKIMVAGAPYTVVASTVLPGAPQMPYVLEGTVDQPTGNSNYEGCNAYRETAKYERWTRPDGTEYLKLIGLGTPTGPFNVCVTTVIDSRNLVTGYGTWSCVYFENVTGSSITYYATVNKTQVKNVENGVVQSTTCGFATGSWAQTSSGGGGTCPGNASSSSTQTLFIPPCPF